MGFTEQDRQFMRRALSLAKRATGRTHPNPMVGAVIVKNGRIIAEGYHKRPGTPHAEAIAIQKAGPEAIGATLYVNLEPCCHRDKRTPPCTDAILQSGIRKVVGAMVDPNPKVSGRGYQILKENGLDVTWGLLEEEAKALNEAYIKYITTGMPFVSLKVAMSLDGKVALPDGQSKWITSEKARREVQRLRASHQAILTGIGTVLADDPLLTVRLRGRPSPIRIVIDPDLRCPEDARILKTPPPTIIVTRKTDTPKAKRIAKGGVSFIGFEGELDLQALMRELAKRGIASVMVEAGSTLPSYLLREGLVDKVYFFVAPKILGGRDSYPAIGGPSCEDLQRAYKLKDMKVRRVGPDLLIEGHIENT